MALAEDGLRRRGHEEQHFPVPLYGRAEQLTNPAKEYVEALERGVPVREMAERYAEI